MKQTQIYYSQLGAMSTGVALDDPQTDNTKLATTDTVYVSPDGGTTNEAFPTPGVEYDFCVDVTNGSDSPSGPFYVRFTLDNGSGGSGNQTFDFKQDAGLDTKQAVKAVVHFGPFTDDDVNYTLSACIFSPDAPETPINCAGTFGFDPHSNKSPDSAGNSASTTNTTDSGASSQTQTGSGQDNNSGTTASTPDSATAATSGSSGTDADGRRLLGQGSWNGATSKSYQGGQGMHYQLKNVNALGTTITINSNLGGNKSLLILPQQTADMQFDCFGTEPMGWTFDISTDSDAFIVAWTLYSTWLPGDPPNQ